MRVALQAMVVTSPVLLTGCGANSNDAALPPTVFVTTLTDLTTCQVDDELVPCATLGEHLHAKLGTNSEAFILITNANGSRVNYASDVARQLRQQGFPHAGVAGFVSEPARSGQ
jgi:hypothetical protein